MTEQIEQRSPEWFASRLGKVTASRVADVIAKTKSGYSASRDNYMAQLICERLTGQQGESFTNAAMTWGTETEPLARSAFEAYADVMVEEVGFVPHPTIEMSGASPDGLVGLFGMLEIKCPNTATHIDTLLSQTVPGKYITQMQWQMRCCERQWCEFVSFDPRLPQDLQLFVKRVEFDPEYVAMLEKEVIQFLAELDDKVNKLTNLKVKNV
ncbi:phage_rel_nuc, putative phage-type endonuclease [uncultured Caudovirales phage]|uniref:Phage_rel_nuc, putative phage-type endonuclease n=1 Tax=uncultured Caudovirales phage TaxID=2100421 RepID=A0A6J5L4B5_9CAUD|nr:phage_rel_nuc, putative phage-type endonuclease [uncultured Caudovirales phage]